MDAQRKTESDPAADTTEGIGFRRLTGLDRSGPRPKQTRSDQPWRPWTLPNVLGYLRLAAIPVFIYLAWQTDDGRTAATALLYLAIAAGDYFDGLLARVTGQYSRLGALMDPLTDRLTALAGAAVCWNFELLPRWALALLVLRELVTMAIARMALGRGLEIEVNWVGRVGTALVFAGLLAALIFGGWFASTLFVAGVFVGIYATVLYIRAGARNR